MVVNVSKNLGDRVKPLSHVFVFDVSNSDSHFETSMLSLEESPNSSLKFPLNTSHISLVYDLSSESSFQNPQVLQLENLTILLFMILCHLTMLLLCLAYHSLVQ